MVSAWIADGDSYPASSTALSTSFESLRSAKLMLVSLGSDFDEDDVSSEVDCFFDDIVGTIIIYEGLPKAGARIIRL